MVLSNHCRLLCWYSRVPGSLCPLLVGSSYIDCPLALGGPAAALAVTDFDPGGV